ncbi:MAG: DUF2461 domain-containing protein [Anaerolineales bacterium]|nr:DUF2461 domain-containing protein [Anaerolineales bacterium]
MDDLSQNNNKAWFDQNRSAYETARGNFLQFIEGIILALSVTEELEGLTAKACMARINRDVRFSKDKSPYKTNFGALVAPGGWAGKAYGYYIGLEPHGNTMVAGGLYSPTPEQLERFRQVIDEDATEFKELTQAGEFVEVFGAPRVNGSRPHQKGMKRRIRRLNYSN